MLGICLNHSTVIGFADCDKKYICTSMPMMPKSSFAKPVTLNNCHSHLGYNPCWLLQCALHGATLEKYPEIAAGAKWVAADQRTVQHNEPGMTTQKDLHWLPRCLLGTICCNDVVL